MFERNILQVVQMKSEPITKEQLRRLREGLFLSRVDLASLIHVSPVLIEKMEYGYRRISPELSESILKVFWDHSGKLSKQLSNIRLTIVSIESYNS